MIIATGSKARHLPNIPVDNKIVADNEGALSFDAVPKKLAVIGAGVIGLELGSVWRRLGSDVTVLEALPEFLGACDQALSKEAAKQFKKQGLDIHVGVKVGEVKTTDSSVSIAYTDKDGNAQTLEADRLIVSIGRVPNTDNLGLEAIGLKADERGFIPVDDHCATSVPNVYAIGDVVRGPMLAHKAEDEGVLVAEIIDGQKPHIDYNCIPWVIYTEPEIAWVGKTEQQLKAEGREIKTGQFPMMANGRALGINKAEGFVKMIADAKTDETARRAHHLGERVGPDRRSRGGDGVQGGVGRHRPDLPSASVAVGSDARSGARRRQARAQHVIPGGSPGSTTKAGGSFPARLRHIYGHHFGATIAAS